MARDSRLSIERYGLHAEDRRERDRQHEADRRIIEAAHRLARAFVTYDDGEPEDPDAAMAEYCAARCGLRAACGVPCPLCKKDDPCSSNS